MGIIIFILFGSLFLGNCVATQNVIVVENFNGPLNQFNIYVSGNNSVALTDNVSFSDPTALNLTGLGGYDMALVKTLDNNLKGAYVLELQFFVFPNITFSNFSIVSLFYDSSRNIGVSIKNNGSNYILLVNGYPHFNVTANQWHKLSISTNYVSYTFNVTLDLNTLGNFSLSDITFSYLILGTFQTLTPQQNHVYGNIIIDNLKLSISLLTEPTPTGQETANLIGFIGAMVGVSISLILVIYAWVYYSQKAKRSLI